jgi:hypothetical protein
MTPPEVAPDPAEAAGTPRMGNAWIKSPQQAPPDGYARSAITRLSGGELCAYFVSLFL